MAGNRKRLTFIWKIKNFSFFLNDNCSKEIFFKYAISGTNWIIKVFTKTSKFKDGFACYIIRQCIDCDIHERKLDLKLSVIDGDESVIKEKWLKKVCCESNFECLIKLSINRDELFLLKKNLSTTHDTFIIRFEVSDSQESTSQLINCFAETRIGTKCISFVGTIEKFSRMEPRKIYKLHKKSSSEEICNFSTNLTNSEDGLMNVEIKSYKPVNYYRCDIYFLDKFQNKVKSGQGEFYDSEMHCIPLVFAKDYLIKYNECFLPLDKLTIHCEVTIPAGEAINKVKYTFDSQDTQDVISNARITDVSSQEHDIENLTNDLISLYKEGFLSDTKLKTDTKTFPAHMAILSARSPVFKSMFTTDMKEKTNKCVDIVDLDADTVSRMLLFMYSATLDDLEYKSAKSLYSAADKYDIVPLRNKCSDFLKQNLLLSNWCSILLLADKHQDIDLKDSVKDYIAENDKAVLSSKEWMDLENNNPHLIVGVYRLIYMKNRRS